MTPIFKDSKYTINWKFNWFLLSQNPGMIYPLLEQHIDKVHSEGVTNNPHMIPLMVRYPNKIEWSQLSRNPNAIPILEKNLDKINWAILSRNPNAMSLIETNLDKIDWSLLSGNRNPKALSLLEKNVDKIDWGWLSNQWKKTTRGIQRRIKCVFVSSRPTDALGQTIAYGVAYLCKNITLKLNVH